MLVERYNFESFRLGPWKSGLSFRSGPEPGELAPDFDLPTVHGGRFRLGDHRGPAPVLLEFVSITCPLMLAARPAMRDLYSRFCNNLRFLSIYIREAHPGEEYPHHMSAAQKIQQARDWAALDRTRWTVAVDGLDGAVHQAYGCAQRSVYLVDSTRHVAFRSLSSDENLLTEKIEHLMHLEKSGSSHINLGEETNVLDVVAGAWASFEPAVRRGGERAKSDFRRELSIVIDAVSGLRERLLQPEPGVDKTRVA